MMVKKILIIGVSTLLGLGVMSQSNAYWHWHTRHVWTNCHAGVCHKHVTNYNRRCVRGQCHAWRTHYHWRWHR